MHACMRLHMLIHMLMHSYIHAYILIGKLSEAPKYITNAENADKRSQGHAGLRYCKGIYSWYTNDVIKAVTEFNLARKDVDWGIY